MTKSFKQMLSRVLISDSGFSCCPKSSFSPPEESDSGSVSTGALEMAQRSTKHFSPGLSQRQGTSNLTTLEALLLGVHKCSQQWWLMVVNGLPLFSTPAAQADRRCVLKLRQRARKGWIHSVQPTSARSASRLTGFRTEPLTPIPHPPAPHRTSVDKGLLAMISRSGS